MVSDIRTHRTVLTRCWRTSCFGLVFLLCSAIVFVMMWLLWCYVGLVAIPTIEPQRRGGGYSGTTSKPNHTTVLANVTHSTPSPSKSVRPPLRGSSRGEAPLLKENSSTARTETSSTSKGESGPRERSKPSSNSSADILNRGPVTDVNHETKRYDEQPPIDTISVRAVSSSSPENRDDLTGAPVRDFDDEGVKKDRRTAELPPARDVGRPVDRPRYDDDIRSRDYDRERGSSRDYADLEPRDRDDRIYPSRSDDRLRRTDLVRPYDDREPSRSERDRSDSSRRRYDDRDDREYSRPSSRRREDELGYRETVRRVDDDYERSRRPLPRDDRYTDRLDDRPKVDRRYEETDRRLSDSTRDRIKDDLYIGSEDRYKSRADGTYRDDRDDRYRADDDGYRRDRYREEDKNRKRPIDDDDYRRDVYRDDDKYRSRDDRYDDRLKPRPVVDDVYRPKSELEASPRRDDLKPRGDVGTYRDEIEPRRSREDSPSSVSSYEPRVRDGLDRSEDSRKYVRESVIDSSPPLRSSIDDDRSRDRKDDRKRYESDIGYVTRSRAPLESDRERPRIRDDPRYDDRIDDQIPRRRYSSDDVDRRRVEDDTDSDRYRDRRLDEERPRPSRTDDDYRVSSTRLNKGDDRGVDRDRPVYIEKDSVLSEGVRTRQDDVTLERRSYSDDGYTRNRPRTDPKLSYDRDDRDDKYKPPPRRVSDTTYTDDRYEGRSRDRYDYDDYDRRDDRRYSRPDPRDDHYDRTRDQIQPSRAAIDERPIRSSVADLPPRDTYPRDSRRTIDDIPPRDEPSYSRESDTRRRDSQLPKSTQTNIREKRYQESEEPCVDGRDRHCSSGGSSPSRFSKDESERALTPKEVIEAAYRHRDEPDRPVEAVYPVFDPRVNNMTSPDTIRPNERRGTTITSRRKRK